MRARLWANEDAVKLTAEGVAADPVFGVEALLQQLGLSLGFQPFFLYPMLLELDDSLLLLVDYQPRLLQALHEGAAALGNAQRLARMAQALRVPLWATEQSPDKLGATAPELTAWLEPSRIMRKTSFSACADGLVQKLRPPAAVLPPQGNARSLPKHLQKSVAPVMRNTLLVAGCEAHVCLLQTALDLLDEEFDVWVVTDACTSRTERNRDAAFDRLAGAGAELVTTEMVAFEWLRSAEHPAFKVLQELIR
jgi:nicotinamidase-related amidase